MLAPGWLDKAAGTFACLFISPTFPGGAGAVPNLNMRAGNVVKTTVKTHQSYHGCLAKLAKDIGISLLRNIFSM